MPKTRAPRGGVVIGGHYFHGGKFIPASVMGQAGSESNLKGPDRAALLKNLRQHKGSADTSHAAHLRKVHDILEKKHGEHTGKRLDAESKALKDAHDKTKDEGHKAHLAMRMGSMHAALDDGSGDEPKGGAPASGGTEAGAHAPTEVGKEPAKGASITLMKEKGSYMAYVGKPGEEEAEGASAEEAIGRLVMENAAKLGITIQGDGNAAEQSNGPDASDKDGTERGDGKD